MKEVALLSKLVEKIELEILTTEESALIGGSSASLLGGNNCKCDGNNCSCKTTGNNCMCNGNNCNCWYPDKPAEPVPDPIPVEPVNPNPGIEINP